MYSKNTFLFDQALGRPFWGADFQPVTPQRSLSVFTPIPLHPCFPMAAFRRRIEFLFGLVNSFSGPSATLFITLQELPAISGSEI